MLLIMRRVIFVLISFVSTVTVARLVPPRAYGLANMAMVLLAFGQIFRDFGLTNAVLRKGIVTQSEISFIFWFNAAMTVTIALILALIAPLAGEFYREPIIKWVILYALTGFVFSGLALQHVALMNREFRYSTIAIIDITTVIMGFVVTLVLAFIRHDVWAIVTGTVVQSVTGAVLFVWASGWRPDRFKRPENMKSLLNFGANASIYSISTFLSNNVAVLLIGRILGTDSVGQYNRAQALYTLPGANLIGPIVQATTPLLARMGAHPHEYRATYLSLVRKVTTFLVPAAAILFFSAPPLVDWLLGPNWHPVGFILSALAPALVGMGVAYAIGDLLITQDRSADLRTIGLIEVVLRVGSIVVGVHFGLVATAIAFTLSTLFAATLRMILAGRRGPVSFRDQISALAPSLPTGVGAIFGSLAMGFALKNAHLGNCPRAILLVSAGGAGAIIVSFFFLNSRLAIVELSDALGLSKGLAIFRKFLRLAG